MLPALTTAASGPLAELERRVLDSSAAIERWFRAQRQAHAPPFELLAFDNCCTRPDHFANPDATPNRFYAYGVVARLAVLAAAIELEETAPEGG